MFGYHYYTFGGPIGIIMHENDYPKYLRVANSFHITIDSEPEPDPNKKGWVRVKGWVQCEPGDVKTFNKVSRRVNKLIQIIGPIPEKYAPDDILSKKF